MIEGIDDQQRQGKGDQHAHFEAAHGDKVDDLYRRGKACHNKHVAQLIPRMLCALGNEEGEDREADPSDHAEGEDLGEEQHACMVDDHYDRGDDLQPVIADDAKRWGFSDHISSVRCLSFA